jgi:type I restriction enzyme S subunit
MSKIDELIKQLSPRGVTTHLITELFQISNGYTPSKANQEYWVDGTIPWVRLEDIRKFGRILDRATQYISPLGVRASGTFEANSIIISTLATIGEHALVTVPFVTNQQITILSIKKEFQSASQSKICILLLL